jgi:hypothetical protein
VQVQLVGGVVVVRPQVRAATDELVVAGFEVVGVDASDGREVAAVFGVGHPERAGVVGLADDEAVGVTGRGSSISTVAP